jgi:hypothetical protein
MNTDKSVMVSHDTEAQFQKYIEDNLATNKQCKILQCHFNNYTDCLKVSFGVVPSYTDIVYRITILQTRPNVRETITGHCDKTTFEKFIQNTITQFTQSVNKTKVCNDWETTFVSADSLAKRHNINTWEGENVDKFAEMIDDITQMVVKNVS